MSDETLRPTTEDAPETQWHRPVIALAFWFGIGCLIYLWDHPENPPIVFNDARSLSQVLVWPLWIAYWFFAWVAGWVVSALGVLAVIGGGFALIVLVGWAWSNRKSTQL